MNYSIPKTTLDTTIRFLQDAAPLYTGRDRERLIRNLIRKLKSLTPQQKPLTT